MRLLLFEIQWYLINIEMTLKMNVQANQNDLACIVGVFLPLRFCWLYVLMFVASLPLLLVRCCLLLLYLLLVVMLFLVKKSFINQYSVNIP